MGRRSRRPAAPSAVIVVDTTVWIDFLEARGTAFDRHLTELVETDAPIALVDIVYCEVLQGIRDEEAYHRTRVSLRAHPILRPRGPTKRRLPHRRHVPGEWCGDLPQRPRLRRPRARIGSDDLPA